MASKLKQAAMQRLIQQSAGNFGVLPTEPTKYQAIQPDAAAYNIFGPQYAAALGKDTGTPAADILNTRALRVNAQDEAQQYIQALAAANENQLKLQSQAGYINANNDILKHDLNPDINQVIGALDVAPDPNGGYIINRNPSQTAIINSENLNSQVADRVQKVGAGVKDLTGSGYILPPDTVGSMISPAGQEKPTTTQENFTPIKLSNGATVLMLPHEVNDYIVALADGRKADAAMIAANAAKLRAEKGSTAGKTVITYDPEGHIASTTVTQPGSDPPEYQPNPSADVHSGDTSAKPSAASLAPVDLDKAAQIIGQFGTVTSTARSREHNAAVGGVSNSFHIDYGHGGHAVDVVPHKGVTVQQVVAELHKQGFRTAEPLNEGDHIHIAIIGGPTAQAAAVPQQRRPVPGGLQRVVQLAQAKGYPTAMLANGVGVRVTFPNGVTRIYNDQGKVQ